MVCLTGTSGPQSGTAYCMHAGGKYLRLRAFFTKLVDSCVWDGLRIAADAGEQGLAHGPQLQQHPPLLSSCTCAAAAGTCLLSTSCPE